MQGWKNTQIVREHVRVLVLVLEQEQNKNMKNFGYWEQEQNENKNIEVKNNKFLEKEKYNICQAHFPTDFVSIECVWSTVDRLLMHEGPLNSKWIKSKVVGLGSKLGLIIFLFNSWSSKLAQMTVLHHPFLLWYIWPYSFDQDRPLLDGPFTSRTFHFTLNI